MNLNLQNFKRLPIHPESLVLVILEMFPKYGNTICSSSLGTAVTTGLLINILLRNISSTNFVQ